MSESVRDRILIVESDPAISNLIAHQALEAAGYQTQVVSDASNGIACAIQTAPDIIIANLNLPGLSGKDLMVALSLQDIQTPIIIVTRKGNEPDLVQAFRLGATDYLLWPLREAEVINVVERVLKQVHERRDRERLSRQLLQTNQDLQQRVEELTTLGSIGKAVTSITDQSLLFDRILEGASKVTRADLGWFLLRDESHKNFYLVGHQNLPPILAERLNLPWEDGISSLVAMSGESLSIHGDSLKRFKIKTLGKSALITPIKVQKEVIGLLIMMRRQPDAFLENEIRLLETISDYASISLSNAHLFRALEERARTLQQMAENAQAGEKINNEILLTVKSELNTSVGKAHAAYEKLSKVANSIRPSSEVQPALAALVTSLKSLDRIEAAISPLPLENGNRLSGKADLTELVRQAVKRAQRFANQNELVLTFEAPGQPVSIAADGLQIAQVLDGLLSNAFKFTPSGGRVTIRLDRTQDGLAHLVIQDTGAGIETSFAEKIFEDGCHPTSPLRFGGLGIRLKLIREILQHFKGKIWVESKASQGSSFHFTLPTQKA